MPDFIVYCSMNLSSLPAGYQNTENCLVNNNYLQTYKGWNDGFVFRQSNYVPENWMTLKFTWVEEHQS